jgi:hypothetical protein
MKIAEEIAISTGNGVWFSNWIDEQIDVIKKIYIKHYNRKLSDKECKDLSERISVDINIKNIKHEN